MEEDVMNYRTHSLGKDLKYLGWIALGAISLTALAFLSQYSFIRDINEARESIGIETVKGKSDLSCLINSGK